MDKEGLKHVFQFDIGKQFFALLRILSAQIIFDFLITLVPVEKCSI